ncbi:hypothetical protein KKE06_05775 [Candidatus Micrarchaeota archaeon]|nr:hypothetical protein [Candidatus Micrarchaeota archaeon]MBU1931002.1 hypothetical protein [Candidatus Micrarchaeota archaeon]
MHNKKVLVMVSWLFIVIIFIGLLAFLWFETKGLQVEILETDSLSEFAIIVSNDSYHAINNVSVVQQEAQEKVLGKIVSLQPQESQTFLIPVQESRITIQAKAPFHETVEKSLFLETPLAFTVSLEIPETLILEETFEAKIRVCNNAPESLILLEERHDPTFFEKEFQTQSHSIPKETCRNTSFYFKPLFTGHTIVIFNIKSASFREQIEKELVIGKR